MVYFRCIMILLLAFALMESVASAQPHGAPAWIAQLPPEQRGKVESIMEEARPRLQALGQQMRAKMLELKTFAYDNNTDPEVLPRLGRELQALRDELLLELEALDDRLESEVGVSAPVRGRGCSSLVPHSATMR